MSVSLRFKERCHRRAEVIEQRVPTPRRDQDSLVPINMTDSEPTVIVFSLEDISTAVFGIIEYFLVVGMRSRNIPHLL